MRVFPRGEYAVNESDGTVTVKNVMEVWCLHTETKPTDKVSDGSIAVEIDTGKVFFFSESSETWVEQFSFQS